MRTDQLIRLYTRCIDGKCGCFFFALAPSRLRGKQVRNLQFLGFAFFNTGSKDIISQCFDARFTDLFPDEVHRFVKCVLTESYEAFNKICNWSEKNFFQLCRDIVNTEVSAYDRPSPGTLFNFGYDA